MTDRSQFKLAIMVLKFVEMDVGSSIATCSLNFWESYLRRKDRDHKFAALVFLLYCCFQVRWCGRRGNRIKGGFTTGITSVDSASHPSPSGCDTDTKHSIKKRVWETESSIFPTARGRQTNLSSSYRINSPSSFIILIRPQKGKSTCREKGTFNQFGPYW